MQQHLKNMSYDKALQKAMWYCSFQERCLLDVKNRFIAWNVEKSDYDKIIDYLIDENYLSEERYIEAFVRGKFVIKKWGKNKIKLGLNQKRIFDERLTAKAFESEIEEEEYLNTIADLITKKRALINEEDELKERDKLYRYMLSKGYESELITKFLK